MSLPPIGKMGQINSSKVQGKLIPKQNYSRLNVAVLNERNLSHNFQITEESLNNKTMNVNNKDYFKRLFILLKRKDKNYSKKRKNIESMKYCFDENNNLYLTLPKLNKNLNEKLSTGDYKKKVEYRYDRYDEKPENIKTDVNYEISVSYTQNEEKSSDNNSESFTSDLNEEEKLSLFDKLKTKSNFMITQIVDERSPQSQKSNNSPQDPIKSLSKNQLNKFIIHKGNNYSKKKGLEKKNICGKNQEKSELKDDPVFQNIYKLVEKLRLIRGQNKSKNLKKKVPSSDLFYYDKKKWVECKTNASNRIIYDMKESKANREATFKKLFFTPNISIKAEDLLKMYK